MYTIPHNIKQKTLVMGQKKIFIIFLLGNKSILRNPLKFPQL